MVGEYMIKRSARDGVAENQHVGLLPHQVEAQKNLNEAMDKLILDLADRGIKIMNFNMTWSYVDGDINIKGGF